MNKGFTLIETILYVSLLSMLVLGVFSSIIGVMYTQQKRPILKDEDYKMLIKNFHE
jgi:type II secretory pathway pseudopilin PulG